MRLYTYFRSSAAWRARILLGLKNLTAEQCPVHLARDGGEQHAPHFVARNPQHLIPVLELDDGTVIAQSIAIAEYLEETRPRPPLLPSDPLARAHIRRIMAAVACDIHPLNNLRVLRYLAHPLGHDEATRDAWYRHWVEEGLAALEAIVAPRAGRFCYGDAPTLADVFLVPQLGNARRYRCDLAACPTLVDIDRRCAELPAFAAARPEAQPDAA